MSDPYAAYKVTTIECPTCDWAFEIPITGMDQVVSCPDCGATLDVSYDASFDHGRWQGRHYVRDTRMSQPIDRLLDDVNWRCTACGAKAGGCDCWEKCSCGWSAEKGKPCRNPETSRCSTKTKYGKYNRKTKRYE